jgi:hypothetical protein
MPTPSRPVSPDQPTRQQLDELDALMERMLALPVNQSGESAGGQDRGTGVPDAAASLTGNAGPESTFYVATTATTPSSSQLATDVDPIETKAQPDPPPITARPPLPAAIALTPSPPRQPQAAGSLQGTSELNVPEWLRAKMSYANWRVSWYLRPVVWCNRAYDAGTSWTGPLGRWLRGAQGRALIGLVGLLVLIAAFAWVAIDGLGWTW